MMSNRSEPTQSGPPIIAESRKCHAPAISRRRLTARRLVRRSAKTARTRYCRTGLALLRLPRMKDGWSSGNRQSAATTRLSLELSKATHKTSFRIVFISPARRGYVPRNKPPLPLTRRRATRMNTRNTERVSFGPAPIRRHGAIILTVFPR